MLTWFINLNNFNIQEAVYVCITHMAYTCLCQTILRRSCEKQLGANVLSPDGMVIHGTILQQCLPPSCVAHPTSLLSFGTLIWLKLSRTFSRKNRWGHLTQTLV